ncbi:hypothetical protein COLO4_04231 [Corchorus olitorius]|uniref:Uncharacterized protein n=1 Tax=Corchorus olitorius TaxID=93759 RepID=A0A1R3KUW7_9ROSI|nr:hypothetical protein COLO4_04231 [Corchorus olitorius]
MARAFGAQTMEVPPAEWLQSSGVLLGYLSSFDLSAQFQSVCMREDYGEGVGRIERESGSVERR